MSCSGNLGNIYGKTKMILDYPIGATPLDADEIEGLIPSHIYTQADLNEWEQSNILDAEQWVNRQHFEIENILSVPFLQALHKRMFGKTWKWAGLFRKSNKNIGVDWIVISIQLKNLLDDICYQQEHSSYLLDEMAARFHHRLVAIHPFPNGNGRHARLMTDIILLANQAERFTWGGEMTRATASLTRQRYINALRLADKSDYSALSKFVRAQ